MRIYTIYMAINTANGKKYIGFDSNWPNRKKDHLRKAFCKSNQGKKYYFHLAIQKYGRDNFEWTVLYQSLDGEHTKNVMENYFITEYQTYSKFPDCNGYNLSLGGDGCLGRKHTPEAIARVKRSKTGKLTARSRPVSTPYGTFDSLAQATLTTVKFGISKGMMHKRITSQYYPEWFYTGSPKAPKQKMSYNCRGVITPHGTFSTIADAAKAIGMLPESVRYRITNDNYPDWKEVVRVNKTPKIPKDNPRHSTPPKTTRITVRTKSVLTPFGVFLGVESAARFIGVCTGTIRYRVHSPKYPDWGYASSMLDV